MDTFFSKLKIFAFIAILVSCNIEDKEIDNDSLSGINENVEWVKQLNLLKENGEKTLTKSMFINNSNLKLISYRYLGDINSNIELDILKSDLTSNKYHFPYYDVENSKINLLTFDEIESLNNCDYISYSKASLTEFLDTTMHINLKKVELEWECDSKNYITICLVSEDAGIIYDNIITNTICLDGHISETTIDAIESNITLVKSNGTPLRRSRTWSTAIDCSWLFGPQRGMVTISHTIYGYKNFLEYSTHSSSNYMDIGKSWADTFINTRLLGSGGYSDCAYGYYMATPSTAINVSFAQGRYHINCEFDFNSAIYGSGISYLSSSEFPTDN